MPNIEMSPGAPNNDEYPDKEAPAKEETKGIKEKEGKKEKQRKHKNDPIQLLIDCSK